MKETAHKLKSLTAFDISGDYLIDQFERLASDDEETVSADERHNACRLPP